MNKTRKDDSQVIKKHFVDMDVLSASRKRIKNIFSNGIPISLSISGGKDSIVLNDLVFKMCQSGEIDKSLIEVDFVDEEAIYPCIEKTVMSMRKQWQSIGVPFNWWCIECKHFNCFNSLTNDESFICWDRTKKDVWVRSMPRFAKTEHPLFRPRVDTYQDFMSRVNKHKITLVGVRCAESIQRRTYVASNKYVKLRAFPIYDWKDSDIWLYIDHNGLDYPKAYEYMYQTGLGLNKMRISQFFSVDTAGSLVKMCEYYPDLFNKICRREPNAYMAMLYFDTELYRRMKKNKKEKDTKDYKAEVLKLFNQPERFQTPSQQNSYKRCKSFALQHALDMTQEVYKSIYQILIGGDPKNREFRRLYQLTFEFKKKL